MRSKCEILHDWWRKVESDLKTARDEAQTGNPATDAVCFHCQQAVEKTFKAWLLWHERTFEPTHNVEVLRRACEEIDRKFAGLAPTTALTPYAVMVRYGDEPIFPSIEEMQEALTLATTAERFVLSKFASIGIDPRRPIGSGL